MKPGPLIILSGPAGAGKTTLARRAVAARPDTLRISVSATTRAPRRGERDGVDYHFWSVERFEERAKAGEFLERAIVHGNLYGTPRSEVDDYRASGKGVILVIDVQGAAQIRSLYPDHLSVFVRAPSEEEYLRRLQHRGESADAIAVRLETARGELLREHEYHKVISNDDLEKAVAEFQELIDQAFARPHE